MKTSLIVQTIFWLLLISCGNGNKQPVKIENNQVTISFDWSKPLALKQNLLSNLQLKKEPTDRILVDFINSYAKLVDEANDVLTKLSNYDSLNTLAYSEDSKIYQCALDFKNNVEKDGFKTASSEGSLYLTQNTSFIKAKTINFLDSVSIEFLNLYCDEIDSICCDDASLVISENSLTDRTYKWGELLEKVSALEYRKIAKDEFYSNLNILFTGDGLDNTPSFDPETKKYNQKYVDCMNEIIKQFPDSKAAKEFKSFLDLLEKENYEKTEKVDDFFKEEFK